MNNSELSYKLGIILHELGMNKTEFLEECKKFSPSMSKPTILNAINGKNTIAPTIETLSTIIKVCQNSGNENLKYISYDYLLNEHIQEVEAKNAAVYQEVGLSDDVINRLKQFNHPLYFDYGNIINYYFIHTSAKHWKYLEMLKRTCDIKKAINENNKKQLLKIWDDEAYQLYVKTNFRSTYDLFNSVKTEATAVLKDLDPLAEVLEKHFRYLLMEMNLKLYDAMNL